MPPARDDLPRIPALDGIRGLAILLVMIHHLFVLNPATTLEWILAYASFQLWIGVDLFFVLSGFLITGILADSKGQPHYFRNFYARRTLRIFPLYYAVLFIAFIILPRVPHPAAQNLARHEGSPLWYWLYLSNFQMAWLGHYTHKALAVTWSLAIEEQFYLVWPAVVWFLSRRSVMTACGLLVLISMATRLYLSIRGASDVTTYTLTPAHLDGLAVGAFIALALRAPAGPAFVHRLFRILGPAALVAALALLILEWRDRHNDQESIPHLPITIYFTLLALIFGWLLTSTLRAAPSSPLTKIFASTPLTFLGKYSYALYLFHYPLAILLRENLLPQLPGPPIARHATVLTLGVTLSILLAVASWHLYEKHFLKLKRHFPSRGHATGS